MTPFHTEILTGSAIDLEAMGDEAKRVCTSTRPSPQVQSIVVRVHDELSNLKHQLH